MKTYPGEFVSSKTRFVSTGEFRPPRKGEYYLSGAIVQAYQAPNDLGQAFYIAVPVEMVECSYCHGTGKTPSRKHNLKLGGAR